MCQHNAVTDASTEADIKEFSMLATVLQVIHRTLTPMAT